MLILTNTNLRTQTSTERWTNDYLVHAHHVLRLAHERVLDTRECRDPQRVYQTNLVLVGVAAHAVCRLLAVRLLALNRGPCMSGLPS